ncbi:MAG: plasmid pRiA4b ORF-3 family protein [Anaerolineae bacterium]|nr:plasmid pRiA4b ORF-3 family protein [Anaerolineae bacterium]
MTKAKANHVEVKHPEDKIYQLKVTLAGSKPPVWRRLAIPGDSTMEEVHAIIQASFDWENAHLHQFILGDERDGIIISHPNFGLGSGRTRTSKAVEKIVSDLGFDEDFLSLDELWDEGVLDESIVFLEDIVSREGARLVYEYDLGDRWEHEILVEKIFDPEPGVEYPVCIDGALSGPPEDCGGIPGYADLLEALKDSKREDHAEALDWVGDDFDPEEFDLDTINAELFYYEDYLVPPEDDFSFDDVAISDEAIEEAIDMINEQTKAFVQEVVSSKDGFALRFPGGVPLVNVVVSQFAAMTYAQYPQLKAIYEVGPGSEPVWVRFTGPKNDIQAVREILGVK